MERKKIAKAFRHAFPYTVPIFAGFWFLAFAYGIYMHVSGFGFLYPTLMSLTIYGGSLEFVAVSMLLSPFAPLQAFLMSLMIQARHLFYGISMLDKLCGLGLEAVLSDLRHVRRDLQRQLFRTAPARCGSGLVLLFRDPPG